MGLRTILNEKIPKKKHCRFYDNGKCILHYKTCYPCSSEIKRIEGVDTISEYLTFVTNRKNNSMILWFTFLSLIISISALFSTIFEDEIKNQFDKEQLPTKNISK
ncbi:hypothetical protein [Flavivirga jejuensis]|uniref:Uncharacterized protein n=1 Tax=Flavivirga jejuensis TaxID=870487 RepID=A0ABT8WVC6_9FLAO|nr:hypothetical protein [Flavivirga jejuensis]MDO5977128.1 hypothetical protein [Flavivirga jejuensis]